MGHISEGCPTKKTPEMVARIAEAIGVGLTYTEVSDLIGIEFTLWLHGTKTQSFLDR
jgi:hypothetical protein